ncbi:DUF6745 domain-containing protein [Nocardiopsis potens]|uniref:DUF6745 domain-containing protein n=1 Tax=Nocardiopsis potens TaxID=1246458 RepID=UPI00034B5CE8|nr:hypothetical protein [Nocardiopsis potens]
MLRSAVRIREEWLRYALCTDPADRPAAEEAVSELYALIGADPPRFAWVDSPCAALGSDSPVPDPRAARWPYALPRSPGGADRPVSARLAELEFALHTHMADRIRRRTDRPLSRVTMRTMSAVRARPPEEGLRLGVPPAQMLQAIVEEPLRGSVQDAVRAPLVSAFSAAAAGLRHGLTWFGQHDAHRFGRYEAWLRSGLVGLSRELERVRRPLAALARSCGWWWPGEEVCVIAERPAAVHTEPLPSDPHGGVRLHRDDGPAVLYRDGWGVHAVHGTPVPAWVVHAPDAARIDAEPNVEVRRTAIERIGWGAYIDEAGFHLVSSAPDPGNPGSELRLYDRAGEVREPPTRVLLAVNGSVERDGRRRRYGLDVPARFDDPVAAAGWTYGLPGEVYARLVRRT